MALPRLFKNAQSQSGREVVPVAFTYLEAAGYGDDAAPGTFQPFLQDVDGNLFVTLGAAGGGTILIPDDADGVAEVSTDSRVPTVARMYGYDDVANNFDRIRTDDDADVFSAADSLPALRVMGRNRLFNEFDGFWQLEHAADSLEIAPSASRTATTTFGNFVNTNWRAAHFIMSITAGAGFDLDFELQARANNLGTFYPLLQSAAASLTATGTTVFKIGIGFTPIANLTANDLLPYIFRVVVTHNNANAVTYAIDCNLSV